MSRMTSKTNSINKNNNNTVNDETNSKQRGINKKSTSVDAEEKQPIIDHDDGSCVVCFNSVEIFSVGECDHPVCFICSTRMRVLCKQNECPICRRDMSQVIFTSEKFPFRDLEIKYRTGVYDKKYRIRFASLKEQSQFYKLLENQCPKCPVHSFPTFEELRTHVRKEHEMFYCDLCIEHLNIFSSERKCYTRSELGLHRRKGDTDNTSHRGHPLCQYCDCRYVDKDELFRHMRREHYLCHLCDADGSNQFYANISAMREHYRNEHYLCEEGDCAQENFTSVFRTDIDLRAHIANVHGRTMSKLANKQTRTLDLEFNLAPRNLRQSNDRYSSRSNRQNEQSTNEYDIPEETFANHTQVIDARNEQDFPSLGHSKSGAGAAAAAMPIVQSSLSIRTKAFGANAYARTKENFPALGNGAGKNNNNNNNNNNYKSSNDAVNLKQGMASALLKTNPKVPSSTHATKMPLEKSKKEKTIDTNRNVNDFPSLPTTSRKGIGGNKNNKIIKHIDNDDDFIAPAPPSSFYTDAIAAKHLNLIDGGGYSSSQPTANQNTKFNMVSAVTSSSSSAAQLSSTEMSTKMNKKPIVSIPKLNSHELFPALAGGSNGNNNEKTSFWGGNQRKSVAISSPSHKIGGTQSKVINNKTTTTTTKPLTKPTTQNPKKKEKSNTNTNTATTKPTQTKKSTNKQQQQRSSFVDNDDDDDDDFDGNDFELSNVLQSVASKYRGMITTATYEPKQNMKKISSFKESDSMGSSTKASNNEHVPNVNSFGAFPTLKEQTKTNAKVTKTTTTTTTTKNPIKPIKIVQTERKQQIDENQNMTNLLKKSNNSNDAQTQQQRKTKNDLNNTNTKMNTLLTSPTQQQQQPPPPPPPGMTRTINGGVPPGFNMQSDLNDDMSPQPPQVYSYLPLPNATQRNQILVGHFHDIFNDLSVVESFKQISQHFLIGLCQPELYYAQCKEVLGNLFDVIFPELLVLLPDIQKQQELYLVHMEQSNKNHSGKSEFDRIQLDICSMCKQVMNASDLTAHTQMHILNNSFPTLDNRNHH